MITMANQVEYRTPIIQFQIPYKNERQSIDELDHPEGNSGTSNHFPPLSMDSSMKIEKNRLDSFKHPNWKCFMDTKKLANAGFFYFGVQDHVRCAFCKVEIGKWEPGDNCEVDHQKYGPMCPFLRGFECGNVPIDPSTRPVRPRSEDVCGRFGIEVRPNSAPEDFGHNINVQPVQHGDKNVNLKDIGMNPHHGPIHKRYCTEESRIATFKEWPRMMKQKPKDLAEAGFFYTGRSDQTTCFHCDLGLKDWEENDDPWEQHARWYSKCTHVLLNKGHEFVQQVISKQPPILSRANALELLEYETSRTSTAISDVTVANNQTASTSTTSSEQINSCSGGGGGGSSSSTQSYEQRGVVTAAAVPPTTVQHSTTNNVINSSTSTVSSTKSSTECNSKQQDQQQPTGDEGCLCQICYLERWNVLFLPCKHALACKKCAPLLTSCPLCREQITATLRIYPSCNHDHRGTS